MYNIRSIASFLYLIKIRYSIWLLLAFSCIQKKNTDLKQDQDRNISPNIILIVTDDQGYGDLGYHGNPWLKTPHLDDFATRSMELTNFHSGTTCSPTRAGIMTGRNANRNNAWHTISGCSILLEDEETIAEIFSKNGYQTAMFGKWHLGDNYPFRPHDRGFQHALYHGGGGIGQTPDYWGNDYFDDTYFRNGSPEKFQGYCTDVWFDQAIHYIKNRQKQPFFIYLAPNAAHGPYNVPEKYAALYQNAPLTDKQKRFYGMISNIDDNFGKLISYLDTTGLSENTILIFTTDNGTAAGIYYLKNKSQWQGYNAGLRGTKGSHYDGGHRVPFFIRWPKGKLMQGTQNNTLAAHVDLLPSLTSLAGISHNPSKPLDGIDITKLFTEKAKIPDRMLIIDTQRQQWPEKYRNSCVMSTEWRLVNGDELYHFVQDPGQQINLAAQHPQQVSKMQAFYENWWASTVADHQYARIPIGKEGIDPVCITIHDMHTEGQLAWNQNMIRENRYDSQGHYTIKIVEEGHYRFRLSRYPPESGLAINQDIPAIPGTTYYEDIPAGKGITVTHALVSIGENSFKEPVDPNQAFVVIEGWLSKGDYEMSSQFFSHEGKIVPAYYTTIQKL